MEKPLRLREVAGRQRHARPRRRRIAPRAEAGYIGPRSRGVLMPGAGTDRTKTAPTLAGPIVVLVEPQLGENIGTTARAMANFGLTRLRLVKPRDQWPNPRARAAASGADAILDEARLYDTLEAA